MSRASPSRPHEPPAALRARTQQLASACNAAAAGFELCARRTDDERVAVATRSAAAFLRALQSAAAHGSKQRAPKRPLRTCERLRWEWLASTATVLDGTPDARLVRECERILSTVDVRKTEGLPERVLARFRAALAEAHSLAAAIERMRRPPLALAFG